jgi:probable HAF family extracellular repeat protein
MTTSRSISGSERTWRPSLEELEQRCLPSYAITDLGTLPGGTDSFATVVNASGQVTGWASSRSSPARAILYDNGTLTDLGTLGGPTSYGNGINNLGQVVGSADTSDGLVHAFLYHDGVMTDLDTLGGSLAQAVSINDAGQIVGQSTTADGSAHAFIYSDGVMTDLGTLGGVNSGANAVNATGQVTGVSAIVEGTTSPVHAYVYRDGVITDLGTLAGFLNSNGFGINGCGQIVGWSYSGTISRATLWQNGVPVDVGSLGGNFNIARGINDLGQVVGASATPTGDSHAFLLRNGTMTDLNDLIPSDSGWLLHDARSITANGFIAGTGMNPDGQVHAFLLTPDDDPGSLVSMRLPVVDPLSAQAIDNSTEGRGRVGFNGQRLRKLPEDISLRIWRVDQSPGSPWPRCP